MSKILIFKILIVFGMFVGIGIVDGIWSTIVYPEVSTNLALEQAANPTTQQDSIYRTIDKINPFFYMYLALLGITGFIMRKEIMRIWNVGFGVLLLALITSLGCWAPYHEKMMVDIGTSEIAILAETVNSNGQAVVVPKDKGKNQGPDGSLVDYYDSRVVNARKVEIPYYWKQTHRYFMWQDGSVGKWTPAARLIVVDTKPETREWTASAKKGTANKDQGIWVESSDSVGFSTGISVTARIDDKDNAINFLSNYPPEMKRSLNTAGGDVFEVEVAGLAQIMDEEVRTKIQEIFAYESAAYTMDELREKKREIMDKIKEQVVPYFEERGITITTIGQFGGFEYENPAIQTAIDKVFEAQQDEEVAKAEAKAAEQRKLALKLKGEGEAQQSIEVSKGRAEGVKLEAEAEADAIKQVADAKAYELEKLQENPEAYLKLKTLEIELEKASRWDGVMPRMMMGESGNFLFQVEPNEVNN